MTAKYIQDKLSRKHHYLPQFYIKGFVNSKGDLFVYDKEKDEISCRKPSQIYFEWNKNISDYGIAKNDLLEVLSSKVESRIAQTFALIRKTDSLLELNKDSNSNQILMFVIDRYLKLPANHHLIEILKPNIVSNVKDINSLRFINLLQHNLMNDSLRKQHVDFMLPYLEVREFINNPIFNLTYYLFQVTDENRFLLSDNPFVFKNEITGYKSIKSNLVVPIAHNKIYIGVEQQTFNYLDYESIVAFNMIQFVQSDRYIGSGDRAVLKTYIGYYKMLKPFLDLKEDKRILFDYIYKD